VFVTHDIDEAIKLANRIAILNVGAKVEQYAPPEEILRAPASDFVSRFVGAERGLKRLALISVADIEIDPGPVVQITAAREEALRAIPGGAETDWLVVLDGEKLVGWIDRHALEGATKVSDVKPREFAAMVTGGSSLRTALDIIVSTRTHVAVVVDDENRYQGIITLDRLTAEIHP